MAQIGPSSGALLGESSEKHRNQYDNQKRPNISVTETNYKRDLRATLSKRTRRVVSQCLFSEGTCDAEVVTIVDGHVGAWSALASRDLQKRIALCALWQQGRRAGMRKWRFV